MKAKLLTIALFFLSSAVYAQTTEVWYFAPIDVEYRVEEDQIYRQCAINRYIPALPDGLGSDWEEAETLGGYCVIWVSTTAAMHATIQADGDFEIVPIPTIPQSLRGRIRSLLRAFGFTDEEVNATGWDSFAIMDLATSENNRYRKKPGAGEIEEHPDHPGRQPPRKPANRMGARNR